MAVSSNKSVVEISREAVDQLYAFRDHYFEKFGIERAVYKNEDVRKKMEETLQLVESQKDNFSNKAEYFMLLGHTLNVTTEYDSRAYEYLSKSVKLDPKLVEAWNHLGEVYWKKGDINNAKNCFSGALTHSQNKVSLRNLSMVLRQLNANPDEQIKNVEDSVNKAKEAVQLDIKDGQSWLILGNAYLSLFFSNGQNPKILQQAMSAYKQAEKDPVAQHNADLHYNRASAYMFEEDYQSALEGFAHASLLDPMWKEAEAQERSLLTYLANVQEMVKDKGKMKGKRLQTLSKSPRDSVLGPYAGGTYTSQSGKSIKLIRCSFKELQVGTNMERVVLGKVVCTVPNEKLVPFTFCMLDEDETCLPVNVYNFALGSGVKIGDSVAIPEPFVQHVKVNYKGQQLDYNSVRVSTPVVLVVNGRKLGRDKEVGTLLVVKALSD